MIDKSALKHMSVSELETVAAQVRASITDTVKRSGGHLAASLGAVELTVALHAVLDTPEDKIVFDVGHQAYAHKLLTGRADAFRTLRSEGGIAGFPRMEESEHDAFGTGHASTGISAALGYARARDLRGEHYTVAVVVGDGALTGGQCYEALNDAGHNQTPMVVILNDNGMSIARNVGALSKYLSRLRSGKGYNRFKQGVQGVIRRLPVGRELIESAALRIKGSVRQLLVNGAFFSSLGFTYLGPVDGHDIASLRLFIRRARALKRPVIIHAVTRKGKGDPEVEARPEQYHNVPPQGVISRPTLGAAAGRKLAEMARKDARIVAVSAAMPHGTGLQHFAERHPSRFFDVGIAEPHAVTLAAGLAAGGMRPFVALYSTFWQRAFDHALHDVALQNLPVVMLVDRTGVCGEDGATHQGLYDAAFFRTVPGITVLCARDAAELERMLEHALSADAPVVIRYGKDCPALDYPVEPLAAGRWQMLEHGGDVALIGMENTVHTALAARALLRERGVEAAVVNARFLKPIDDAWLAANTLPVVTVEECAPAGGLGEAVAAYYALRGGAPPMRMLCAPDAPLAHGAAEAVRKAAGLSPEHIAAAAAKLIMD